MRYLAIIVSVMMLSFTGGIEIPASIKRSFVQRFPTAHNIRWEGTAQTHYEVGFVDEGKDKIAVFLPDGTFKETETEIKTSEIPKRVLKAVGKKYPLSKISFALKIQRSNNTTVYDLEVNTGVEDLDITLDPMGYEVD
ncbi:MAG: PepSY-like domain-containing protein [Bacteroidia bacterium]|nr:PepSY-like domain-containing protein [Sphingobacteriaceae bacterium]MBK7310619.1 PepSY-like domain-containing protein [Sphingobacteriaceae bacterium]MBK7817706.1 PepSY-like domain-containing protein [Sphingobacteriaceae bacterium]MBP9069856.1 PepSY-like domain-containing protein [Bacteroidia bacterium]